MSADSPDSVALGALVVSVLSLGLSTFTSWKSSRDRRNDLFLQEQRFEQLNVPEILAKPNFSLAHGNNRLIIEVVNLHSSIAIKELLVTCTSHISFDDKTENQNETGTLPSLLPNQNAAIEVPFFCDFDSFANNLGEIRFPFGGGWGSRAREAAVRIQQMGYLKNRQPSVGTFSLRWSYRPAQPGAEIVRREVSYPLYIWLYKHGIFLSFEWAAVAATDVQWLEGAAELIRILDLEDR